MAPRVLLIAGPGGAGSSTAAARVADHLAGAGRPVTVLDTDPYDGAGARCSDPAVVRGAARRSGDSDAAVRLLEALGDSADLVDPVRHTITATLLRLLWSIPLDAGSEHTVVIDAGTSGPELARLARTLPSTLSRLSRVGSKWLRTTRPLLAAMGGRGPAGSALLAQLQEGADRARAIRGVVCGGAGGAAFVAGDEKKTARIGVGVGLSGVRVRGVVAHEDSNGFLPGVTRIAAPEALVDRTWDTEPPLRISTDSATEGYRMRMPLPLNDFRELRLRWSGHSLTLAAWGHQSVLDLPSTLQRCRPSGARLRDGMLDVAFRPTRSRSLT